MYKHREDRNTLHNLNPNEGAFNASGIPRNVKHVLLQNGPKLHRWGFARPQGGLLNPNTFRQSMGQRTDVNDYMVPETPQTLPNDVGVMCRPPRRRLPYAALHCLIVQWRETIGSPNPRTGRYCY